MTWPQAEGNKELCAETFRLFGFLIPFCVIITATFKVA
jgi:hypothetical protein